MSTVFLRLAGLTLLSAALLCSSAGVSAISPIGTYGNRFFYENGSQFFIKGVAYQLTSEDPLLDKDQCSRDASLMQQLGANAIRVYHVDASSDHSDCMAVFADAGIYLLADLDTFDTYILPTSPWWNQTQYERFAAVMDEFQKYDNMLGFFVGNEVIAQASQSLAAPFIKAAARDLKAYRDSKNYRRIPVGYAAADIAQLRPMLQDYLTCGENASDMVDFFSLNSYEWCGSSSFILSGYSNLEDEAVDFPVPIFFSETGCNTARPRTFEDQAAIFGPDMVNDWSGAIIYEWIQETNDYGLISYGPAVDASAIGSGVVAGFIRSGTPTPILPDFSSLQAQWQTLTPTGVQSSEMNLASLSTRACPASTPGGWLVAADMGLPSVGETLYGSSYVTSAPTGSPTCSSTASSIGSSSDSSPNTSSSKSPAKPCSGATKTSAGLVTLLVIMWL